MQQTLAFQRVYWGGAAVMLAVDEAIRRETGGRKNLDDVVADVNARAAISPASFPARDVIAMMDDALGSPIVSRTVEPWLHARDLPPVTLPAPWMP